jgi:2-aminomuconate deaminase
MIEMAENSKFSTAKAPKPVGLYPHARRVGNLLFLSGVGPRTAGSDATDSQVPGLELDKNGNFIAFDFEAQCRSVFDNVRMILEESGSSWGNLVDVTVFLVNMKRDFHTYNRIYAEYFKDNQPCRTTVEINSLPTPIAIELKCIATID